MASEKTAIERNANHGLPYWRLQEEKPKMAKRSNFDPASRALQRDSAHGSLSSLPAESSDQRTNQARLRNTSDMF